MRIILDEHDIRNAIISLIHEKNLKIDGPVVINSDDGGIYAEIEVRD